MNKLIQLNAQTAGKDKTARLIQYTCRLLWDSLQSNEINSNLIDKLKTLEFNLSSFRKLLRFGKCVDVFYSTLSSMHQPDIVLRVTITVNKIASSIFLFCDHIIWLSRSGLFKKINITKWNELANKYWFLSIVMNLLRDFYEILRLIDSSNNSTIKAQRKLNCITSPADLLHLSLRTYECLFFHKAIVIDTIKNACDLFIPLTAMGYTKLDPRFIGLLGVISSLAGLIAVIQPSAKLLPA